jgi:putative DNA primase/helicase
VVAGRIDSSALFNRAGRKSASHGDVKVKEVDWLWPGRFPMGQVSLIAGRTDSGKSLALADAIARVTIGADWPDGAGPAPLGEVLVFGEDSIASIQNPRLIAAGADLAKVRHWRGPFYLELHLDDLRADLAAHPNTKLIVFDPLGDYITATSYAKVRKVMSSLRELARDKGVAVIGIGHPPKGFPHPVDAFGGSRAGVLVPGEGR